MTTTTRRPVAGRAAVRAGACVAVFAAGAMALAACSGSSSSGKDTAGSTTSASASASGAAAGGGANGQAMDAYRECLSQHGVNLPTFNRPSGGTRPSGRPSGAPSGRPSGGYGGGYGGGFGGGGFPGMGGASADPKTQQALQACASKRPSFSGRGGPGGQGGGMNSSAFQAFTSCLKDHGVTVPTATAPPGAGGHGGSGPGAFNTSDPKYAKAYATCKVLLPQRPSSSPTAS
ncbi:hypothetical protein [Actinacidiphila yeochonensis]|uniref:hypothetical protein n=1 Tax=Actinacidiphila yeochonensis TaxID=89050 RepID=UPI00068BC81B|nr:hypothetical protein [Actinacidiphila yeochonensis]